MRGERHTPRTTMGPMEILSIRVSAAVVAPFGRGDRHAKVEFAAASSADSTTELGPVSNMKLTGRSFTLPGTINSPSVRRRIVTSPEDPT
jgi:hypothetical protein